MEKILISKCLMGEKVNYLGNHTFCSHPILKKWLEEGRLISVCPEVQGGLPIPRPPAAIIGSGGGASVLDGQAQVTTNNGADVTEPFINGAKAALKVAQKHNIRLAILKARSPSCGSDMIYDGSFNQTLISGDGVTAALLRKNNIAVFTEEQIEQAEVYLRSLQALSPDQND